MKCVAEYIVGIYYVCQCTKLGDIAYSCNCFTVCILIGTIVAVRGKI